ncbi:hypothetical protein AK830_g3625 [Neonectria ditissima]|uniref:Uncharacterized protein n=1 Tax=Neonectria ditissima TaxID=78410 RepID=A0A0P7BR52_9HYPO|nr:hypothetical protein AK830_g3625 [Neonectria ditissima]
MRYHDFFSLVFDLRVRLGTLFVPKQTTAQPLAGPFTLDDPTSGHNPDNILKRQEESWATCGYVDGEPVTCNAGSCGLLVVFGRDNAYLGCCDVGGCVFPTACIEEGSADDSLTLECTESQSPVCATFTWPDYSAESYSCAKSSTTVTVTESTSYTTAYSTAEPPETTEPGETATEPGETASETSTVPGETISLPDETATEPGETRVSTGTEQRTVTITASSDPPVSTEKPEPPDGLESSGSPTARGTPR